MEPELPVEKCVNINDVATDVVNRSRHYSYYRWKVNVANRCKRPLTVVVRFDIYDRHDFAIQATVEPLQVPARDIAAAQGTMVLSVGDLRRISTKKVNMSVR